MSDFLQYGGQAVIEGVMMRSPRFFAVACRKPDQSIVVHCASGYRSAVAASLLQREGFSQVADLVGGLAAWRAIGELQPADQ